MKTQTTLKTSIIAALMITVAAATAAQAQAEQTEAVRNSLTGGSWSMQFRIGDNFSLSSFEGSTISLKKHFTDKSALRLGVSVSHANDDQIIVSSRSTDIEYGYSDPNLDRSQSDYRVGDDKGYGRSRTTAGVSAVYMYYPTPQKKISAFFGVGPSIRYAKSTRSSDIDNPVITNSVDSSTRFATDSDEWASTTWSYGANFACGVEWFAGKNISFMAEYSLGASYDKTSMKNTETKHRFEVQAGRSRTSDITYDTNSISDGFSVNSSNVKFGISVYF